MKKCTRCGEEKPLSEYTKDRDKKDGLSCACRSCSREKNRLWSSKNTQKETERSRRWRQKNPGKHRFFRLKGMYGISKDEYEKMLAEQGGVCAICGGEDATGNLSVDHDHETGWVRGLLCRKCNACLGMINDDVVVAQRMANYLSAEYRLKKLFDIPIEFPAVKLSRMQL